MPDAMGRIAQPSFVLYGVTHRGAQSDHTEQGIERKVDGVCRTGLRRHHPKLKESEETEKNARFGQSSTMWQRRHDGVVRDR